MTAPCPEYGFRLRVRLAGDLTDAVRGSLRSAFHDAVTARGLVASGGGDREWYYEVTREGGQVVDADREALAAWAAGRAEVADVVIGQLVDLTDAR